MTKYVIMIILALLFCGCAKSEKIYGLAELPENWQLLFGNSNISRLNYAQSQRIEAQGAEIKRLIAQLEAREINK
jgi:hypothetical protein